MLACNLLLWSVYAVTVEWIATISLLNCPTLVIVVFTGVANTTSTFIGVGVVGVMKWWGKPPKSHSKGILDNFLHQYLPELLVNVYSYRVMVKVCLAVVCVEAGFCQIQSQIHM